MAAPVRVYLLDDHEVVRQGVRALLHTTDDLVVVGESGHLDQGVAQIRELQPDVAILDARFPNGSGLEACRVVRSQNPKIAVLMLTSYDDREALFTAVMAGASGYLMKEVGSSDLISAVRDVAAGRSLIPPAVVTSLVERLRRGDAPDSELDALTGQQRRVLALIAEGLTNRQIGERLFLAEKTVKNHVSAIFVKLGIERRTQAAVLASRLLADNPPV